MDVLSRTTVYCGIDEAGRGPLAGPVTAACIVLPDNYNNPFVADSKKLSKTKRERLFVELTQSAVAYAIVSVGPRRIEKLNILESTRLAMKLSAERVVSKIRELNFGDDVCLLIDGNSRIDTSYSQKTIIKGDQTVPLISAASILAKVRRDYLMKLTEQAYPGYGFSKHKGYPTRDHIEVIMGKGPCKVHRRTFAGVREHIGLSRLS